MLGVVRADQQCLCMCVCLGVGVALWILNLALHLRLLRQFEEWVRGSNDVPRGMVWGLLFFKIYKLPLGNIIRKHIINLLGKHTTWLCFQPGGVRLQCCLIDIKAWMFLIFFYFYVLLNSCTTEVMVKGSVELRDQFFSCHRPFSSLSSTFASNNVIRKLGALFQTGSDHHCHH